MDKETEFIFDIGFVNSLFLLIGSICESKGENSKKRILRIQENTGKLIKSFMDMFPEYQLTKEDCKLIAFASSFHDVGKIKIPDYILNKQSKLTKEEFDLIKKHPIFGFDILNSFLSDACHETFRQHIFDICLYHHERYDGRGYPYNLVGDEIPISAQIVGLIDVYDALLHEHVYRGAYNKKETLKMIVEGKCGKFNPKLIEAFKNSPLFDES